MVWLIMLEVIKPILLLLDERFALSSINSIPFDEVEEKIADWDKIITTPINDYWNVSDQNWIISAVKWEVPKWFDIITTWAWWTPYISPNTDSINLIPISESEKADLISWEVRADINESFSLDPLIEKVLLELSVLK